MRWDLRGFPVQDWIIGFLAWGKAGPDPPHAQETYIGVISQVAACMLQLSPLP